MAAILIHVIWKHECTFLSCHVYTSHTDRRHLLNCQMCCVNREKMRREPQFSHKLPVHAW